MMISRKSLFLGLVLFSILLASCITPEDMPGGRGSSDTNSYLKEGFEGVDIEFASGAPPEEMLFRGEGGEPLPFEVEVRVTNTGTSLTKGGVYLSGYDPSIIEFEEIKPRDSFKDCMYTIDNMGFGSFEGSIMCRELDLGIAGKPEVGIGFGEYGLIIDLRKLNLGAILDRVFNSSFFEKSGFDTGSVRFEIGGNGGRLDVNFEKEELDPRLGERGPYFLSLWAPFDFSDNFGKEFMIPGDLPQWPGGGEEYLIWHGKVKDMPRGIMKTTQPIMATACYLYTTTVTPTVCIDTNPASQSPKACRSVSQSFRKGQGGPVAVTSISSYPTTGMEFFTITIEDLGDGTVYNPTRITACNPHYPLPATPADVNSVVVGMVSIGNYRLPCSFSYPDTVLLHDGKGTFNCWYEFDKNPLPSTSAFETPMIIELWHGYSETARTSITVHKLMAP